MLQGVNLEVPTGSFVGMVGGSGSGKSTLLKMLPRFYKPNTGKVLIDGLDVNKVELYSLRRQIGVVPQDSLLFDGSVRENLLLVKPDATAEEMVQSGGLPAPMSSSWRCPRGTTPMSVSAEPALGRPTPTPGPGPGGASKPVDAHPR